MKYSPFARNIINAADKRFPELIRGRDNSINELVRLLGGDVMYIPKRPGEPDCTFADIQKIESELHWKPTVSFKRGVEIMLSRIEDWKDAPVWEKQTIHEATRDWFKYLHKAIYLHSYYKTILLISCGKR